MLMAIAFEHGSGNKDETIKELHGIWEGVYRTIGLRQGLNTESLRFAATLKSASQRSKPLGEEDAVDSLTGQSGTDPALDVKTSLWLLQVATADEQCLGPTHLSQAVTRIAHTRLLAISIILAHILQQSEA